MSSAAASILFDRVLDAAQSLGLLSENQRDSLTDELARGETTEREIAEEWGALVAAEQRVVNSKEAGNYLYRLVRSSERARGSESLIGAEAQTMVRTSRLSRSGAYCGVQGMDDTFIHLSTAAQVRKTALLYFKGARPFFRPCCPWLSLRARRRRRRPHAAQVQ